MILQLGYILQTVPAWKKSHSLRVLVFVEYESEVEEERGRVRALLDKLRIEAEVLVFWLASGDLATYETIIHGKPDAEDVVNECLKSEEWWDDLQYHRGSRSMTASQEFDPAQILEPRYNPHSGSAGAAERRRRSWAHLNEFPRKPTVSQLVKMGVSMGIHTQNLPVAVLDSSETDVGGSGSETDSSDDDLDGNFNDGESVASEGEPVRRPLLTALQRRRSHGDVLSPKTPRKERKAKTTQKTQTIPSYGTIGPSDREGGDRGRDPTRGSVLNKLDPNRSSSGTGKLERPTLSRQGSTAMKFSSMLVPETTITNEDGTGPRIMFAEVENRPERPPFSRQSSVARYLNRTASDVRLSGDEGKNDGESGHGHRTPAISRKNSMSKKRNSSGDALVDIPELLSSYQFPDTDGSEGGSSYSTQGLALSFNDLPPRAQHLILNELMRKNSNDTAVLFTTLPIPKEGTCQSEEASLAYLSDVEVLCHELPPMLLVLSNNMTVTVSL